MKQNIFLVGPMGAGKTTIGRQLAARIGFEFVDSDQVIQERTGVDIPTIFEFEGEAGFRRRERDVIEELTARQRVCLATGGGVVLDADNRAWLVGRGFVCFLYCSPEQQYQRTFRDRGRPLLQTDDPRRTLTDLMKQREPLYREVADLVVSTEDRGTSAIVEQIIAASEGQPA
jgi:shikimate kinase